MLINLIIRYRRTGNVCEVLIIANCEFPPHLQTLETHKINPAMNTSSSTSALQEEPHRPHCLCGKGPQQHRPQPMVASDNALQDTYAIINARHVVWLLSHTTTCTGCRWVWSNRLQSQSLETQLPYLHRKRKHFTMHLKPILRYSAVKISGKVGSTKASRCCFH